LDVPRRGRIEHCRRGARCLLLFSGNAVTIGNAAPACNASNPHPVPELGILRQALWPSMFTRFDDVAWRSIVHRGQAAEWGAAGLMGSWAWQGGRWAF
jgi:hypothetical protein